MTSLRPIVSTVTVAVDDSIGRSECPNVSLLRNVYTKTLRLFLLQGTTMMNGFALRMCRVKYDGVFVIKFRNVHVIYHMEIARGNFCWGWC